MGSLCRGQNHCSHTVHHCSSTVHALKNIKNWSHGTIHTFKNYFAIVFSVSVFSFSKNKLNPNGPQIYSNPVFLLGLFSCIREKKKRKKEKHMQLC